MLFVVVDDLSNKSFIYFVQVDIGGQTFQPNTTSLNKKEAKALAAKYALQQMGYLPHVQTDPIPQQQQQPVQQAPVFQPQQQYQPQSQQQQQAPSMMLPPATPLMHPMKRIQNAHKLSSFQDF